MKPNDPNCPTCGTRLEKVRQSAESSLNAYQFLAIRAGDWYCKTCPDNSRGKSGLCYWWDREIADATLKAAGVEEQPK